MNEQVIVVLFSLFIVKHFLADFLWQTNPYLWQNKHKYGHPGGIIHALIHGVITFVILMCTLMYNHINNFPLVFFLTIGEMWVHYHIDYFKMNINNIKGWKCDSSDQFWILTGLDQMLHYLTYVCIISILVMCNVHN